METLNSTKPPPISSATAHKPKRVGNMKPVNIAMPVQVAPTIIGLRMPIVSASRPE